jgi:O-antigen/teichoic acid export membrane protein
LLVIAQSALNALLSLAFVLILHLAWRGRTWGICVSSLAVCALALASLYRDGWIPHRPVRDQIRDALRFGMPLIPHVMGALLIATMDRVMITNFLGVAHTGIYAVALQMGMVVSVITSASNKAFAPWLFRQLREQTTEIRIRIVRITYAYFAALIVLAMVVGFGAPPLMSVLVGESFHAASGIIIYIALGCAFSGMYLMVTNYVFWVGATGRLSVVSSLAGIVNLLISYWAISMYGLEGASYGFLVSQIVLFLGTWYLAQNVFPMPWRHAFNLPFSK